MTLTGKQLAKSQLNVLIQTRVYSIKKVLLLEQEGLFQQASFTVNMGMALVPALTFSPSDRPISIKAKGFDATWNLHDVKLFKRDEMLQSLFAISFLPEFFSRLVKEFLYELSHQARELGMEVSTEAPQVKCPMGKR